jgi:NitT/TauT family transport system substrate-binding protein
VACRAWLVDRGYRVTQTGGDVTVVPTQNPDQLALFQKKELDAVWTVEPWVSRLEMEAGGRVLVEEEDSPTTVLVASARFLREEPEIARRFVAAHAELTRWIVDHAGEAQERVREELHAETTRPVTAELVAHCWRRLRFDDAVAPADFDAFLRAAQRVGFLREAVDLARLVESPR